MKISIRIALLIVAGVLVLFAPTASADTASMLLTGVGSNGAMGGVYVGPYVATVNGVAGTPVICDDYSDESYLYESWTANVSTFADLSNTKWASLNNSTTLYEEAAWLTEQLVSAPPSQAADIQFAIWAIFDPAALGTLSATDQTNVEMLIANAQTQTFWTGEFANILIYTPNIDDPILCGGQSCQNTPPQEFMIVTPEPSELALLLVGLLGCAIVIARKNRSAARLEQAT